MSFITSGVTGDGGVTGISMLSHIVSKKTGFNLSTAMFYVEFLFLPQKVLGVPSGSWTVFCKMNAMHGIGKVLHKSICTWYWVW